MKLLVLLLHSVEVGTLHCRLWSAGAGEVGLWRSGVGGEGTPSHPSTFPQVLLLRLLLFCAVSSVRSCLVTWSSPCHPLLCVGPSLSAAPL